MYNTDAFSAYTQSFLGGGRGQGTPTWVSLPRHRWPASWEGKYENPVVPLILSLYGHPDSGGYWEAHCEKAVVKCGWEKVDGWQSVFWHPTKTAMLVIYVDDFKLACKREHSEGLWRDLRKEIVLDPPADPDRFLGCYLEEFETSPEKVRFILENHPDLHPRGQDLPNPLVSVPSENGIRGFLRNMNKYLESSVEKYCAVAGILREDLKKVSTPFLDESLFQQGCCEQAPPDEPEAGSDAEVGDDIATVN